jgi:hypothetical protein
MATVINNPPADQSGGPIGIIIVLIVLLVVGYLGFVYGLPAIQRMQAPQINVTAPEINVPDQINVNVQEAK